MSQSKLSLFLIAAYLLLETTPPKGIPMRSWLFLLMAEAILIIAPVATDNSLSSRLTRYDKLALQYECNAPKCAADFDGDGLAGVLRVDDETVPPKEAYPGWQRWLVAVDSGNEIFRIPFQYADGSLRTHAAIRVEADRSRLIIFDHDGTGAPMRQVFAWNGRSMV